MCLHKGKIKFIWSITLYLFIILTFNILHYVLWPPPKLFLSAFQKTLKPLSSAGYRKVVSQFLLILSTSSGIGGKFLQSYLISLGFIEPYDSPTIYAFKFL